MSQAKLGDTVTIATPGGTIRGKMIGQERRTDPRRRDAPPRDFVCLISGEDTQWHPAEAITRVEPDLTTRVLQDLITKVGRPHVERVLSQMA